MADATTDTNTAQTTQTAKPQRAMVPVGMDAFGMLRPSNLMEAIEVAKLIAHSGIVPKIFEGSPGAVLVAIQMGSEIGLTPMAALQGIAVINGRPSIWGDAMLAVVRAHHECDDVAEDFDAKTMTATCTVKRRGKSPVVRTFSQEDAKTAGLWGKGGPWTQYPKRMLAMRARAFALRDSFPDALRGIHCVEEVRDVIDVTPAYVDKATGEPKEGTFSIRGKKNGGNGKDEAVAALAEIAAKPDHDPVTGEVKEEQKAAEPEKPAEVKQVEQAPAPKGQRKLGW